MQSLRYTELCHAYDDSVATMHVQCYPHILKDSCLAMLAIPLNSMLSTECLYQRDLLQLRAPMVLGILA